MNRPADLFCDPRPDAPVVLLHPSKKANPEQFLHLSTWELIGKAKRHLKQCGCPNLAHSVGDRYSAYAFLTGVSRPIKAGRMLR